MNQMGNRVGLSALMKLVVCSLIQSLIQQRGTEHPLGSSAKAKDLTQVSTNFFCEGPMSKHFQLGGSEVSVAATQLCLVEGNSHRQDCVPAKAIYKKGGGPGLASCPG